MPHDTLRERVAKAVQSALGVDKPDLVVRCRVVSIAAVVDAVLAEVGKGKRRAV